jgi:hypothetical protein
VVREVQKGARVRPHSPASLYHNDLCSRVILACRPALDPGQPFSRDDAQYVGQVLAATLRSFLTGEVSLAYLLSDGVLNGPRTHRLRPQSGPMLRSQMPWRLTSRAMMNSAALSHSGHFARTCGGRPLKPPSVPRPFSGPLSVWHPPGAPPPPPQCRLRPAARQEAPQLVPVPPVAARGGLLRRQRGIKRFGLVFAGQPLVQGLIDLPDSLIDVAPRVVVVDTPVAETALPGSRTQVRCGSRYLAGPPGVIPWRPLSL